MLAAAQMLGVAALRVLQHLARCALPGDQATRAAHTIGLARDAARWLTQDARLAAAVFTVRLDAPPS